MAKIVEYYEKAGEYYVREDWQDIEEGKPWAECPYPETAKDAIDNLATSYTNALNNAEWIAEGEAKQAFLSASDVIVTFFSSKDDSMQSLFGDLSGMKEEYKGLITGSSVAMFDYLSKQMPESLDGEFITKVGVKEGDSTTRNPQRFMETYQKSKQAKNTYELFSTTKDLVELKRGMSLEKQLAEKVKEAGKAGNDTKVKDLSKRLEEQINKDDTKLESLKNKASQKGKEIISEYFAIWAPAVITVMYDPKYRNMNWKEIRKHPVREQEIKTEIKNRIIFEARCNMFAAKAMGWLSSLGIILLKVGMTCKNILDKVVYGMLGLLIVHSAQSISNGVKAAYGEYLKQKEDETKDEDKNKNVDISWKKIISLGLEVTKDNLLDLKKYVGASRMHFTFPYETKGYNPNQDINYIIVEKEIDAPGVFEGMKAFLAEDSLNSLAVQLDNTTLFNSNNLSAVTNKITNKDISIDYSKLVKQNSQNLAKFEIKNGSTNYIGVVEQIGHFYQEQIKEEEDIEFTAYYNFNQQGDKKIKEILDEVFNGDPTKVSTENLKYYDTARIDRKLNSEKQSKNIKNVIVPNNNNKINRYLDDLSNYFGEEYAKRLLKEETIIVITNGSADMSPNILTVKSIDIIDQEAKKFGLDLSNDPLSYKIILDELFNKKFIRSNWVGNTIDSSLDYNYIIFEKEIQSRNPADYIDNKNHDFFKVGRNSISGSINLETDKSQNSTRVDNKSGMKEDKTNDIKLWTGIGMINYYKEEEYTKDVIKKSKIIINGEQIGSNLKRRLENEYLTLGDQVKYQEYVESFKQDNSRILEVIYYYTSFEHFFKILKKNTLKIKYRVKYKDQSNNNSNSSWNVLMIREFDDLDYNIDLPDKGYSLPGLNHNRKYDYNKALSNSSLSLEGVTDKARGKLRLNDKYIKGKNLEVLRNKKPRLVYKVMESDMLREIAEEYLGEANRWRELEKEDGSNFTEEEAKKLKVGSKVYIPNQLSEVTGHQDETKNNYVKDNRDNIYINYFDDKQETKTLCIEGFQEGDYGLWVEEKAPYYLDGNKIVSKNGKEASKSEILAIEENKFLEEEERIKDNFLWIYPEDTIIFPDEKEESQENSDSQKSSKAATASTTSGEENKKDKKKEEQQEQEGEDTSSIARGSGSERLYVCNGAKLKCSLGTGPSTLSVADKYQVYIQSKPMATIKDTSMSKFGSKCKRSSDPTPPCTPKPTGSWQGGKNDVTIHDIPTLLETSTIKCGYGGSIKITNPGQSLVRE
ncbi:DUF4280 domain-containing protein [Selenihalanaerobacter shriftii]|uniref:DUF4280 domain-containing protein n=1 Tax=Selenihalanaerobacter shriftii TaxID=142842 RepID=A0A1T4M799_9FIRM|nr:DUF4280 domain-containing protein [Selenihalanaerobacter shriftii]SJZ62668.1 protein of unknown function [Selenihalanaerobacter shriftii]